jgi:localization factor PodJL
MGITPLTMGSPTILPILAADRLSITQYWTNLAVSVQSELAQRGYYKGAIDGVIGSDSREAIRAFQAAQGLPVTGAIDTKLLDALGIKYKTG